MKDFQTAFLYQVRIVLGMSFGTLTWSCHIQFHNGSFGNIFRNFSYCRYGYWLFLVTRNLCFASHLSN